MSFVGCLPCTRYCARPQECSHEQGGGALLSGKFQSVGRKQFGGAKIFSTSDCSVKEQTGDSEQPGGPV